ncbi:MAG: RraA family protein [bacterium]|jgi:regulator of RNase E activity RraA
MSSTFTPHPESLLEHLRQFDTPTICNALELAAPERRTTGFTYKQLFCARPDLPPIIGYARTATIRARNATDPQLKRENALRYYEYVAQAPRPSVIVIQDLDDEPGFGAHWGEVNTNVHKGLGALGVVTNGSIRDLDVIADDFQLLAGKVGPSHAWVHVEDCGCDVDVFGMYAQHNDLIHADRHGAVVIPHAAAEKLPECIDLLTRREKVILDACKRSDFSFEVLREAMGASAEIH